MLDTPISTGDDQEQRTAREKLAAARGLLQKEGPELAAFFEALFAASPPEDILRSTPEGLVDLARCEVSA